MTEEKVAEVVTESNGQEKKEDANAEEKPDLDSAIIRQVEYYFGDLNLPRDKFLREQVKLDEGWIPLDILIKFNRLAQLTTDLEVIASALNKSTTGLLEVSEDNKKVRRSPEVPLPEMNEERRKDLASRTVYAKGFPKDLVLDDLLKFYKQYDEVENVIMRKYVDVKTKNRLFKGSVFATFKTKEQAEKFIETKDLKYGDNALITKWQDAYVTEKQEEYAAKKEKREKKPKQEDAAEKPKEDFKLPTGTVLYFTQSNDKFKREDIKEGLEKLECEIAYIDFKVGESQGWVRLTKENAAKEVIEKIPDGKLTVGETEVTLKVLEGDEEKAYLDKTIDEIAKRRKTQKNNRHNRQGKHFKGKQQHGKKRKQGHHDDAPSTKVKADS